MSSTSSASEHHVCSRRDRRDGHRPGVAMDSWGEHNCRQRPACMRLGGVPSIDNGQPEPRDASPPHRPNHRDPRSPDRVRHDERQVEPRADRLHRGPAARRRRQLPPHPRPGPAQGLAMGDDRPGGPRRLCAVGAHGHGSRRRPELDQRSVQADGARRPPLRPRHLRHEGLRRRMPGDAARDVRGQAQRPLAPRDLLRRGGRLRRRAPDAVGGREAAGANRSAASSASRR